MSLSNRNPEQSQENNAANKPAKDCQRKFYITMIAILLIEVPQIASAWIAIAEKMPLLQRGYIKVIELVLKTSAK